MLGEFGKRSLCLDQDADPVTSRCNLVGRVMCAGDCYEIPVIVFRIEMGT